MLRRCLFAILITVAAVATATAEPRMLDARLHHLRVGPIREWADFPQQPDGPNLTVKFKSNANDTEWALRLRHQDVRQTWRVMLNGKELGRLRPDENDMVNESRPSMALHHRSSQVNNVLTRR